MNKIKESVFIIALMGAAIASIGAEKTIILQEGVNDYAGCEDTFISQEKSKSKLNYGGAKWGTATYKAWGFNRYVLIRFANIFGKGKNQISQGSKIKSAKLSLYVYQSGKAAPKLQAHELLEKCIYGNNDGKIASNNGCSWNYCVGDKVKWNKNASSGPKADVAFTKTPIAVYGGEKPSSGWISFDITKLINEYSIGKANYGILIKDTASYSLTYYRSAEYKDASLRPKLTIAFDSNLIQKQKYAPIDKDTDFDGLSDKEELVLGTDPNKFDTDGDTIDDAHDANPLVAEYKLPENQDENQYLVGALIALRYFYDLAANYYGFNFAEVDGVKNKPGQDFIGWTDNPEDTYKRGLRLVVRLYSGSLVNKMRELPKDIKMVNSKGEKIKNSWGSYTTPFTYPEYQKLKSEFPAWGEPSELIAAGIKQVPAMWIIGNEPGESVPLGSDYSIWAKKDFRRWCKQKYSSIASMNKKLKTSFADWGKIEPPKCATENRRLWLTWQYYRQDMLNNSMKLCVDAISKIDPFNRPISVKETPEWHRSGFGCTAVSFEKTANLTTIFGVDSYPADPRWMLKDVDLSRSLSGGQDVWIGETGAGSSPEIITQSAWAAITRNVKALNFFLFVFSKHHSMFKNENLEKAKDGSFATAQFAFETKRIGSLLKQAKLPPFRVALYFPEEVFLQHQGDTGKTNAIAARRFYHDILGTLFALYDSQLQVDFISPTQIQKGGLDKYKALYLISAWDMNPAVIQKIKTWTKDGGCLFADARAAFFNQYHENVDFQLKDIFPVKQKSITMKVNSPLVLKSKVSYLPSMTLETLKYMGKKAYQTICKQSFEPLNNTVRVIARYNDNSVAAVQTRYGKGTAILVGSDIGRAYSTREGKIENDKNQKNIAKFISYIAFKAGVVPYTVILSAKEPERIVKGTLLGKDADLVVLVNRADMKTCWGDKRGDSNGGLSPLLNTVLKTKVKGKLIGVYSIDDNSRRLSKLPYTRLGEWVKYTIPKISIAKIIIFAKDFEPTIGLSFNKKTFSKNSVIKARITVDNLSKKTISGTVTVSSRLWFKNPTFTVTNVKPGDRVTKNITIDLAKIQMRKNWGKITPRGRREIIRVRGYFNGKLSYPAIDDIFIK